MVQVDKFKMPMDFIVLEIKEALMRQREHMVFLGRTFMETTKTVIDVQNGKLSMTVSNETIKLKVVDSKPYPFSNFPNQCSCI